MSKEETIFTLRFGSETQMIQNYVKVNELLTTRQSSHNLAVEVCDERGAVDCGSRLLNIRDNMKVLELRLESRVQNV